MLRKGFGAFDQERFLRASEICGKISEGFILLVGFNVARLIPRPELLPDTIIGFDVPYGTVREMIEDHQLGEVKEEGYPPVAERKRAGGWKRGWREMGLAPPMEGQAYYLLIQ